MNDKQKQKQVSLAGAASGKRGVKQPEKTGKKLWWLIPLPLLLVTGILIAVFARGCDEAGPTMAARDTVGYTVTKDKQASKVSYFALGVLGEQSTDRMDMVAVLCYDRQAEKAAIMQMPVATYIGEDGDFATPILGDVWGNPKTLVWCDTCRGKVAEKDIDGVNHAVCGTRLTSRKGSSFTNFNEVFNKQYGLPIDNYLVIPRKGLVTLIDAVGGVDMTVNEPFTVEEVRYEKGVRTLSGAAAVQYAIEQGYNGTPNTDCARIVRQRELLASLLDRLSTYTVDELYNTEPSRVDVLSNVMLGANPIRYDTSSFGRARLMGVSEKKAENVKYIIALAEFIHAISRVDGEDFTVFTLPGVTQKRGTNTVYSVNKAQTIALLKEYMNPYGLTLDDETVNIPELTQNTQSEETAVVTLDEVLVKAEKGVALTPEKK